MNLKEKIKAKRKAAGFSQEQIAEQLELSCMTVRRWESGKVSPRIEELEHVARILNTTVADLIGLEDGAVHNRGEALSGKKEIAEAVAEAGSVESFLDATPADTPPPSFAYWGEVVDQARKVAERENPEEINVVASLLEAAFGLLADAKRRTFDLEQDGRYGKPKDVGESKTA